MAMMDPKPVLILVVEDEALVRMLASDILTDDGGHRVIEAVSADEAMVLLEARHDVRLVFTDVDMPGQLNGFALARIIDMRFPGIKVIVTSGRTTPGVGDLPKGMRFLPKPYAPSDLLAMVQELLVRTERPIVMRPQYSAPVEQGSALLPAAVKIDQIHTGIGIAGGLAQPLPEPEE